MTPEEALADCLTEIEAGRKTVAECVALFPDIPDLEDQLQAAQALRAWQAPTIRPEISRRLEARVRQRTLSRRSRNSGFLALSLRWAVVFTLLAFLFVSAGAVAASSNSLPGEVLYPVKRAAESAQLFLASPADRAALHTAFAGHRLNEIAALAGRGPLKAEVLATLAAEIAAETGAALAEVKNAPAANQAALLNTIILETERQQTVLQQIKDTAPSQLQAQLDRALEAAARNNAHALNDAGAANGETVSPTPALTHTPQVTQARPTSAPTTTMVATTETAAGPTATPAVTTSVTSFNPTYTPESHTPEPPGRTHTPPGQAKKTETAASLPAGASTSTPGNSQPGETPGGPNCTANNPNSPNYCTPAPAATSNNPPPENNPAATACPTNASGKPKCK